MGEGADAMIWTSLVVRAAEFDPALLNLAFVFLLLGYGTKVGLAPLHAWLPDAHAEGPTPISAVLSGLLLNVALYALLRFKMLLAVNPAALAPGPLLGLFGLAATEVWIRVVGVLAFNIGVYYWAAAAAESRPVFVASVAAPKANCRASPG